MVALGPVGLASRDDADLVCWTAALLRNGPEVLAQDSGMSCRDSEQADGWSIRGPAALLPVAEGMNADPHRLSELDLRQPDELPQRRDV